MASQDRKTEVEVIALTSEDVAKLKTILSPPEIDVIKKIRQVLVDTGYGNVTANIAYGRITGTNELRSRKFEKPKA